MVTDFSMNVQKLGQMAEKLREIAAAHDGKLKAEIARLEMPGDAFPVFDAGCASAYTVLHTAAGDAAEALAAALKDVASALHTVVKHYREMETEHGRAFDTALPDGAGGTGPEGTSG